MSWDDLLHREEVKCEGSNFLAFLVGMIFTLILQRIYCEIFGDCTGISILGGV
jgi:hypothetical protein